MKDAPCNVKEPASAKIEDFRQGSVQKAEQLREAAQGKAQEFTGAAENTWSDGV